MFYFYNTMNTKLHKYLIGNNYKLKGSIIRLTKSFNTKKPLDLTYSFMLPLILSKLDLNVNDSHSNITHLSYGVFLITLVALLCLINIIGYIIDDERGEKIKIGA